MRCNFSLFLALCLLGLLFAVGMSAPTAMATVDELEKRQSPVADFPGLLTSLNNLKAEMDALSAGTSLASREGGSVAASAAVSAVLPDLVGLIPTLAGSLVGTVTTLTNSQYRRLLWALCDLFSAAAKLLSIVSATVSPSAAKTLLITLVDALSPTLGPLLANVGLAADLSVRLKVTISIANLGPALAALANI